MFVYRYIGTGFEVRKERLTRNLLDKKQYCNNWLNINMSSAKLLWQKRYLLQ